MPASRIKIGEAMGERGISSIIVVAIIIVVAAVAALGGYFIGTRGGGGGPQGLSKYSGSQAWNIPSTYRENIPGSVEVVGYSVSGVSVQDLLDWYKGQMAGWTLEDEVTNTSIGEVTIGALSYIKGNDSVGIIAMSGVGLKGTCYILATGSWSDIISTVDLLVPRGAPPSVMLTVSAQAQGSNVVLTISHNGGDDLDISDLAVKGSDSTGAMVTATISPLSGTLSVGESMTATYSYGASSSGNVITVYVINNPSKQKLFSSSAITVQPSTTVSKPSVMLTVGALAQGYNVLLIISHNGGDDLNISDLKVEGSDTNGVMQTATLDPREGTLSVDGTMTAYYDFGADPSDEVINVYIIHLPSNQKLFASSNIIVQ
jgi:hypothetical protein